jgi:hypothetical protein
MPSNPAGLGRSVKEEDRRKIPMKNLLAACVPVVVATLPVQRSAADEGMWLMNQLPAGRLKAAHGFEPDADWVEHVQKSCVRFGRGASASFVSPRGLIMTNHHVGSGTIRKLSDAEHDYLKDGYYAATLDRELPCPALHVDVLMAIEDVTDRVNAGVTPQMSPAEALAVRKEAEAAIEKQARETTGFQPQIVVLFGGARYHLYLYKRYTDVRFVMAPEQAIAYFGGDNENFSYPRYDLDVSFFRAYEDGQPARIEHYLKWSADGAQDGQFVFLAGHPYRTSRLHTLDHLRFLRDVQFPLKLQVYNQREVALMQFIARSDEHRRIGLGDLLGVQNGRKALDWRLRGLLDAGIVQRKAQAERALREAVVADPTRRAAYASAWDEMSQALAAARSFYPAYFVLEDRSWLYGRLYSVARDLVRWAAEREKPDGRRLAEYRDVGLPALKRHLFSPAPIYAELERMRLEDSLTMLSRVLGGDHPAVRTALAGQTPEQRAAQLVAGTRLKDVAYRRQLFEGGSSAIAASDDAMIRFLGDLDPVARKFRERYEDELQSIERAAYARIAKASFAANGNTTYPDASSTLRLSFGTVSGYEENGESIAPLTTLRGAYELAARHSHQAPYLLPKSWMDRKDRLDLGTPFNFVCTADIIGGNSGSPVFNAQAEVVGIVFDGNIQGLVWDYHFDQRQGRAVGVHSRAIIEALRKVYDAGGLADELLGAVP